MNNSLATPFHFLLPSVSAVTAAPPPGELVILQLSFWSPPRGSEVMLMVNGIAVSFAFLTHGNQPPSIHLLRIDGACLSWCEDLPRLKSAC
ncbi:hypothetical protein CEXT_480931 [Caerostris extrusa]|uniref:Uncharacterized protein n=1 Tax=Caerostris extrusa TaxID=172846 RepID=A0AAV4RBP2_CAEEX|nr:hypothetical protein CEXT_480931 [Caerostris extrusa]